MAINLRLDLDKRPDSLPITFIRVGDANIDSIAGTVTQNGEPFDLTGYTIALEGISATGNSVTDSHVTIVSATAGEFQYTFSSAIANAGGRYKSAYFSFTKNEQRTTTGNIDLFVYKNISSNVTPVTAEQIDTYNDLVKKLMDLNDNNMTILNQQTKDFGDKIANYISGTDLEFKDYSAQLAKLIANTQSQISTMRGPQGEKGDPGTGLMLKGKVDSVSALPTTATAGDGYLIGQNIYVWVDGAWFDGGTFQGEKGDKGDPGNDGVVPDLTEYMKVVKSSGNSRETAISDSTKDAKFYYWEG